MMKQTHVQTQELQNKSCYFFTIKGGREREEGRYAHNVSDIMNKQTVNLRVCTYVTQPQPYIVTLNLLVTPHKTHLLRKMNPWYEKNSQLLVKGLQSLGLPHVSIQMTLQTCSLHTSLNII